LTRIVYKGVYSAYYYTILKQGRYLCKPIVVPPPSTGTTTFSFQVEAYLIEIDSQDLLQWSLCHV